MTKTMYVPLSDEELMLSIRCDIAPGMDWSSVRTCKAVEMPDEVLRVVEREVCLLDESSEVRVILQEWLSQFQENEDEQGA